MRTPPPPLVLPVHVFAIAINGAKDLHASDVLIEERAMGEKTAIRE